MQASTQVLEAIWASLGSQAAEPLARVALLAECDSAWSAPGLVLDPSQVSLDPFQSAALALFPPFPEHAAAPTAPPPFPGGIGSFFDGSQTRGSL